MNPQVEHTEKQPLWFLILLALAVGGSAVGYVPLLTVLLPLKITALIGAEDVPSLARVTFYGAVVASLANIAFGMVSDRSGRRPRWIVAGLFLSSILLLLIGRAGSMFELIILIMLWQLALNLMLAPLLAWAGDCVPDSQKGLLGGLLAMAPALGAIAGSLVTFESLVPEGLRLSLVVIMVILLVCPVLIFGRGRERPQLMLHSSEHQFEEPGGRLVTPTVRRMWMARFLVQISEAGLFAFLLFWLRSLSEGFHENTSANILSAVLIVSIPLSLLVGRWSDKNSKPIMPLVTCATLAGVGLGVMAVAHEIPLAIAGYVVFGIGASIFLALHTSQTLRVLPKPEHRGRDLGVFNLTNTIPSIAMPWLTLSLVPSFGFAALFWLFAGLAVLAAILLATIPRRS